MNFQNLEEYYDYLENDNNFRYLDLNTYKFITDLRDRTDEDRLKKICSYELFFADFSIVNGVHIPKFQNGANAYPTLELFDDNFDYIKSRANSVNNPKYKAKYNHLLWLSPKNILILPNKQLKIIYCSCRTHRFPLMIIYNVIHLANISKIFFCCVKQ